MVCSDIPSPTTNTLMCYKIGLALVLTGFQNKNGLLKRLGLYLLWRWRCELSPRRVKVCSSTNQCTTHLAWLLMTTIGILSMCRSSKAKRDILSTLKALSELSLRKMLHYSSCVTPIIR